MKIAYFDCPSGASGDMILAALLDAGVPEIDLREGLDALQLDTFDFIVQPVIKKGFRATEIMVDVKGKSPPRRLKEILAILEASNLDSSIKDSAEEIFHRLASVEAGIHGNRIEETHLHELSGDDTIVDVVGVLLGLQALGIERIVGSPLPLGRGYVDSAHGKIPLPAPATLEILKNVPVYGRQYEVELVTPTAAVLLSTLAHSFGEIPEMTLERTGYGAGRYELPIPNLLRVLVGSSTMSGSKGEVETVCLLETNLDDLNPQFYEHLFHRLFDAGALDVFLTAIQMKKSRPGTLISILCQPEIVELLEGILFTETSTLGVRRRMLERHALPRTTRQIQTSWGEVRIKIAWMGENNLKVAPEFEDCRLLAEQHQISLRDVYQEAQAKAQAWLSTSGKDVVFPGDF